MAVVYVVCQPFWDKVSQVWHAKSEGFEKFCKNLNSI